MTELFAKIEGGVVTALWRYAPDRAPEGLVPVGDNKVGIGWQYDGGEFIAPEPVLAPPPDLVSKLQFAKALTKWPPPIITTDEAKAWVAAGAVPQLALDAIAASDMSQEQKDDAEIDAAGATEIPRLSPLVAMLQAHPDINMTDEERDALFVFAATL